MARVGTRSVAAIQIVSRIAQERQRVPVRPAFAHAVGLRSAQRLTAADQPPAQAVRVFVDDNFRVQIAIPSRRHLGEDVHLHAWRRAIGRGGHVGVVRAAAIQRIRLHGVIAEAAATEIVHLEIARRLGEAQFVKPVVHPVADVEELHHRRRRVVGWILRGQIHREIKHPEGRALRAREVWRIIGVPIGVGIGVVAPGLVHAIVDPAIGRSVGVEGGQRDQRPGHDGRLIGQGRRMPR